MMKVLVVYATKHGATKTIAERIAETIHHAGLTVTLKPADDDPDPGGHDAVVIGSAVYMGSWRKSAHDYIRAHEDALRERPVWLFSSGPLGEHLEDLEKWTPKEVPALEKRVQVRAHKVFKGALERDHLSLMERIAVRVVKAPEGDFREWQEIDEWAQGVADALVSEAEH